MTADADPRVPGLCFPPRPPANTCLVFLLLVAQSPRAELYVAPSRRAHYLPRPHTELTLHGRGAGGGRGGAAPGARATRRPRTKLRRREGGAQSREVTQTVLREGLGDARPWQQHVHGPPLGK